MENEIAEEFKKDFSRFMAIVTMAQMGIPLDHKEKEIQSLMDKYNYSTIVEIEMKSKNFNPRSMDQDIEDAISDSFYRNFWGVK